MNKEKVLLFLKSLIPYVVIVLVVVLIRSFLFTPIKVIGPSMNPTLASGDIMILNKVAKIDRFDIVVISSDKSPEVLIKRVIGLPGETIEINNGIIYINGKEIKDKYGQGVTTTFPETKIPKGEYFVLGDNRPISADSRVFGTFEEADIKGTTRLTIFPFKHFGMKR